MRVRTTKDLDVNVVGSFILGYPGETLAEMDETVHLSLKLGIDLAQYSLLTPYPGTPVFGVSGPRTSYPRMTTIISRAWTR